MAIQKVGRVSLKNQGGFVAKIQISYMDDNGEKQRTGRSGDIPLGQTHSVDPGDMGVPDGTMIYLYVWVAGGKANESSRMLAYNRGNTTTANFSISGTTLDNDLGLMDFG